APAANGDAWQAPVMWLGAFFVLATIGFTMAAIPYAATAGEMTDDPGERSIMLGYRMAFASVGILIGGGVIPLLAGGTRDGTFMAVVMISPVVLISIWGSLYATRHAPRVQTPSTQQMFETLRLVFRNTPFLVLVVFYGIMTLAIAQITAGMPLAAKYLVDGGNLTLLFAPFVVGAMASQILWTLLSLRMGKAPAMAIGVMCYIGVTALLYVALPSTSLALIMGLMLLAGIANGAYQAIPWAMYPDLMDVTRHDTGAAIEGAFSAVWLFGQKVANALAPLLLGGYIMAAGWRETTEGTVDQSDAALAALHQAMTVMPMGIFCVAAVVFLGVYRPMTRRFLRTL
ncbi:MAG: MFS transporter, partial [Pseudomonadota bacterium]